MRRRTQLDHGNYAAFKLQAAQDEAEELPDINPRVQEQVDTVLGTGATDAQRDQAYALTQDYVDNVGGLGDAGIEPYALPQRSAEILKDNDIPIVADPKVIDAVDSQLPAQPTSEDVSPQQRRQAYEVTQDYIDDVGGIGEDGIVAEALPSVAGRLLRQEGLPSRYEQEVVDAVDQSIGLGASYPMRERGYKIAQDYVDDVGGLSDRGINPEALPDRVEGLLADNGLPTRTAPGAEPEPQPIDLDADPTSLGLDDPDFWDQANPGVYTDGDLQYVVLPDDAELRPFVRDEKEFFSETVDDLAAPNSVVINGNPYGLSNSGRAGAFFGSGPLDPGNSNPEGAIIADGQRIAAPMSRSAFTSATTRTAATGSARVIHRPA